MCDLLYCQQRGEDGHEVRYRQVRRFGTLHEGNAKKVATWPQDSWKAGAFVMQTSYGSMNFLAYER